ncbi:endonuclease III domain-containing protein [Singulisphaera sp. PoT]|uniref:endonuclease III domain-containing protein n=1 Tax=Singulisphaera sp. PoT TaxID=3411797 RepID=UPI003BF568D6
MATQSKAQFLNDVLAQLKKRYKQKPERATPKLTVLEAVIFGICHEDGTREQANKALTRFKEDFFDWNEVRVSSLEEIQGVLAGLPNAEDRAYRLRRFLRQLFEKTYGFTLEALAKKPLKESMKLLQEYELLLASDYVLAAVVQYALGGHALPLDSSLRRVLERLGIAEAEVDLPTLRGTLERAIPKNRAGEFLELFEDLAGDTCIEGVPDCPRCELVKMCPTGLGQKEVGETAKASSAKTSKEKAPKEPKVGAKAPTAVAKPAKDAPPAPAPAAAPQKTAKGKSSGTK